MSRHEHKHEARGAKYRRCSENEINNIKEIIQKEYGIRVSRVTAMLNGYKLVAHKQIFYLRATNMSAAEWFFSKCIHNHLQNNEFSNVWVPKPRISEEYSMNLNGKEYILEDDKKFQPIDYNSEKDINELIDFVIKFHKAGIKCNPEPGAKSNVKWGKLFIEVKNCVIGLNKYIKDAKGSKENERFESILARYGEVYLAQAQKAYSILAEPNYINEVEKHMKLNNICIGDFSRDRLVKTREGIFVKYLDKCCYDLPCTDIARVIQKNIYKPMLAKKIIDSFIEKRGITKDELKIIYCIVLTPFNFYRFTKRYYSSKAGIDKERLTDRFIRLVENSQKRSDILDYIESLI